MKRRMLNQNGVSITQFPGEENHVGSIEYYRDGVPLKCGTIQKR